MFDLPLFPLNTVLFPGMPLQLHIFEERYKQMVKFCLEHDSRFGVVLIKQGVEAWGAIAQPFSVGCIARISNYEKLSQGRYNLWAIGEERIEILDLKHDLPYLVGSVRNYPLQTHAPAKVFELMRSLQPWVERYLRALAQGEEMEKVIQQIPTTPEVFAYLGAMVLQIPSVQKQPFIEAEECLNLLQQLRAIYQREVFFLEHKAFRQPGPMEGGFSLN
jgi:Lon protease-like protein